jgi:dCTP diphosphatase
VSREQAAVRQFAQERDWDQFHTPKNLAMALGGEVGELTAIFQWLTPEESAEIMDTQQAQHVRDELADVLIYALRLADVLDVDLEAALSDKLVRNASRYAVESSFGNAKKH